jgi:hypothetical protein
MRFNKQFSATGNKLIFTFRFSRLFAFVDKGSLSCITVHNLSALYHPFADLQFENYDVHVTPFRLYDITRGMSSLWMSYNVNNREREGGHIISSMDLGKTSL